MSGRSSARVTVSNANGISAKGKQLAWAEGQLYLKAGWLNLRRTGDRRSFYRVEARRVPNLYVLMALAEQGKQSM